MNVLITGACGGLGRAFAVECARRGYNLFLTDINERGLADLVFGLRRRFHVFVLAKSCDLTRPDAAQALLGEAAQQGFGLDMLLNVAGVDFEGGFLQREREKLDTIVNLNIRATLDLTHMALAQRNPCREFYVVFVSSLAALYPMPLKATYAASKRFLHDFSLALARELKDQNTHALALCPAGLATTQEAMTAIAAQGFWGSATTNRMERTVRRTLDCALRNRSVYIPGWLNRALAALGALLPKKTVANMVYKRWRAARLRHAEVV